MSLIELLLFIGLLVLVAYVAYWIINKFLPAPMRTPALIVVGLLALIVLLVKFFPGLANIRVGG